MTHRLDPPHDRVTLSPAERLAFGLLERELDGAATPPDDPGMPAMSRRAQALSHLLWMPRLAPVVTIVGVLLMVVALPSSIVLSLIGALLATGGAAVITRRRGRRLAARLRRGQRGR